MESKTSGLARKIVAETAQRMTPQERSEVLEWAQRSLVVVEDRSLTKTQKLLQLRDLKPSAPTLRILKTVIQMTKGFVWDNQSWARRLAFGGFAVGAVAFGPEAAGIAALGGAVGVPLVLVTAAGATLLGVLIDELSKGAK